MAEKRNRSWPMVLPTATPCIQSQKNPHVPFVDIPILHNIAGTGTVLYSFMIPFAVDLVLYIRSKTDRPWPEIRYRRHSNRQEQTMIYQLMPGKHLQF